MTHVLVARQDNDGDVLLAGPVIRAAAATADRVTLLCGPRGAQAAALLPGADEILVHPAAWVDPTTDLVDRARTDALVDDLAERGVDQALLLTSFHQSPLPLALLLRLAGVPTIAAVSVDYPGALLDVRHWVSDELHEVERGLSLAATLGHRLPPGDDGRLRVRGSADRPLAGAEPPYVVVHPGASVPARAWAPERNAELVEALTSSGRRVVVTGAASERELTARVAGPRALDLGGATTLSGLAGVLAHADVLVVGNTGPTHLAAAVGAPIVELFAPTVPAHRWRPWGVPHVLLHREVPCAGCRARACPVPGHPCLGGVTVPEVVAAVERLATHREAVLA